MFTRQPVAGTRSRFATPSACVYPWCMSQTSPSSVSPMIDDAAAGGGGLGR
jgi:hypothetical protein